MFSNKKKKSTDFIVHKFLFVVGLHFLRSSVLSSFIFESTVFFKITSFFGFPVQRFA